MDRYHIRLLLLGAAVFLTAAVIVIVVRSDRSHDLVLKIEPINAGDEITVFAGGAVATPGLYTLPAHARVATLLAQAGILETADQSTLQMAAELHDGQQVIVPVRAIGATQQPTSAPEPRPANLPPRPPRLSARLTSTPRLLSNLSRFPA